MSKDDPNDKSTRDTHYATLRRAVRDAKRERGEIPTPQQPKRRNRGAEDWKPRSLRRIRSTFTACIPCVRRFPIPNGNSSSCRLP